MNAQAELTPISAATFVDTNAIQLQQGRSLPLTSASPTGRSRSIFSRTRPAWSPRPSPARLSPRSLPIAPEPLCQRPADIDGFNLILDGGRYDLNMQADQLSQDMTAGVSVTPTNGLNLLPAPQTQSLVSNLCTATIAATSVNLRSGPGTGYSVLDFGFQGDQFTVGGVNPESNWIVIGTNSGSAWVTRDGAQLNGDCTSLNVLTSRCGMPSLPRSLFKPRQAQA